MVTRPHGNGCRCRACVPDELTTLRRRVAELEAERDRMRPVCDAAVRWHDDTMAHGDSLVIHVAAYLAATPKEGE